MFGIGRNLKKKLFKKNKEISSTVTTRTWVFSTEWTRTWPSTGTQMRKWWWFSFVWMLDVLIHGAWVVYHINKDRGNESLLLRAFSRHVISMIFLKYSKHGRFSLNHLGIWNIPLDVWYNDTKHFQMQSEYRHIQNPFKHLRACVLDKQPTAKSC